MSKKKKVKKSKKATKKAIKKTVKKNKKVKKIKKIKKKLKVKSKAKQKVKTAKKAIKKTKNKLVARLKKVTKKITKRKASIQKKVVVAKKEISQGFGDVKQRVQEAVYGIGAAATQVQENAITPLMDEIGDAADELATEAKGMVTDVVDGVDESMEA